MIRSMTGFCSIREILDDATFTLDIKTLNNKGFDFHFHAPRSLLMLEIRIRDYIKERIPRGRVEFLMRGNRMFLEQKSIMANVEMAKQYHDAAKAVAAAIQIHFEPKIDTFLTMNGVLESEETICTLDEAWERLRGFVDKAITGIEQFRLNEGNALEKELNQLLSTIETVGNEVAELRPVVLDELRQKLIDRIGEWKQKVDMDENRIIQEVALLGDRSDIQEELVRLKGHIQQFRDALNENNGKDQYQPIGRRLDFLCQEMFREINTIGSKCSNLEISKRVIQLKTTADQMREQVQNVE